MHQVVPPVDVLEQVERVAPRLQAHRDDEQQVEQPRQPQLIRHHQQQERAGQPHRVLQAAREEEHHRGGGERQAQQVKRIAQVRMPIAEEHPAEQPPAPGARRVTGRAAGGSRRT